MSSFYDSFFGITPTADGGAITDSGLVLPNPATYGAAAANVPAAAPSTADFGQWFMNTPGLGTDLFTPGFQKWFMSTPGLGTPIQVPGDNSAPSQNLAAPLNTLNNAGNVSSGIVGAALITGGAVLAGVLLVILGAWSIVKD